jgi:hypothetical protein
MGRTWQSTTNAPEAAPANIPECANSFRIASINPVLGWLGCDSLVWAPSACNNLQSKKCSRAINNCTERISGTGGLVEGGNQMDDIWLAGGAHDKRFAIGFGPLSSSLLHRIRTSQAQEGIGGDIRPSRLHGDAMLRGHGLHV